jgi:proprotein convertase subtilisin/kexin type 5
MINKLAKTFLLLIICFLTIHTQETLKTCEDGKWLKDDKTCIKCLSSCKTCKNLDGCLTCGKDKFLHKNYCRNSCPKPLYGTPSTQKCVTKCKSEEIQHDNLCLTKCPDKKINFKKGGVSTCVDNCTEGYYKNPLTNTCVTTCPEKYETYKETRECVLCDQSCDTCKGSTK